MPTDIQQENKDSGKAYIEAKNFFEAINCYKIAIELNPNDYDAWFYLAFALQNNQQTDDSIIAYQKALSLNPASWNACNNLGNIYYTVKNDPLTALNYYKKIVENQPENNKAKIGLALSYLKTKNYKEGWKYFESRNSDILSSNGILTPDSIIKPLWRGELIQNKTLYVYYEAGYGDTIMFARFLPLLKDKCAKVLFRPQTDCVKLFEDSNLGVEILTKKFQEYQMNFDFHIPMRSLPYALKLNTEADIAFENKYLKSDIKKVKAYKEKYFNNNDFKIGINWQGAAGCGPNRKFMLKSFCKLLDLQNIKFYSIQVDEGIEQLSEVIEYNIVDLGSTFNDFSDTAAAMENLDLIISNDTSVVHLAGALGKNVWALLPFVQDWRWGVDTNYCPWYKSIKLFKQKNLGNWDDIFDEIYEELKKLLTYSIC